MGNTFITITAVNLAMAAIQPDHASIFVIGAIGTFRHAAHTADTVDASVSSNAGVNSHPANPTGRHGGWCTDAVDAYVARDAGIDSHSANTPSRYGGNGAPAINAGVADGTPVDSGLANSAGIDCLGWVSRSASSAPASESGHAHVSVA